MADKCKKCGSTNLEIKKSGPHEGLYCKDCGSWIRWVRKNEHLEERINVSVVNENEDCPYCSKEFVIPVAWDEGAIINWMNPPQNFCPVCGKKLGKLKY